MRGIAVAQSKGVSHNPNRKTQVETTSSQFECTAVTHPGQASNEVVVCEVESTEGAQWAHAAYRKSVHTELHTLMDALQTTMRTAHVTVSQLNPLLTLLCRVVEHPRTPAYVAQEAEQVRRAVYSWRVLTLGVLELEAEVHRLADKILVCEGKDATQDDVLDSVNEALCLASRTVGYLTELRGQCAELPYELASLWGATYGALFNKFSLSSSEALLELPSTRAGQHRRHLQKLGRDPSREN